MTQECGHGRGAARQTREVCSQIAQFLLSATKTDPPAHHPQCRTMEIRAERDPPLIAAIARGGRRDRIRRSRPLPTAARRHACQEQPARRVLQGKDSPPAGPALPQYIQLHSRVKLPGSARRQVFPALSTTNNPPLPQKLPHIRTTDTSARVRALLKPGTPR